MKSFLVLPAIAIFLLLNGCASITTGVRQPVTVDTTPVKGAHCRLVNNKGEWIIQSTPGTANIRRSYGNLNVNCTKKGFKSKHRVVESSTKAMVFGNAVFGGIIGAGIDVADGAAYHYPEFIAVPMGRS